MALMANVGFVSTAGLKRDFSDEAALFRAFGDAHRLTIVAKLVRANEPLCVRTLCAGMEINQSCVSHHLTVLCDAGIVVGERRGTWSFYRIAPKMRVRVAGALRAVLCERWGPRDES